MWLYADESNHTSLKVTVTVMGPELEEIIEPIGRPKTEQR
jgi:hypothetical protein